MSDDLALLITDLARRARAASLVLATSSLAARNGALERLATLIDASHEALLAANAKDLAAAQEHQLTPAQIDRLTLSPTRLQQLAAAVREVVALPDPLGESLGQWSRPNGLQIEKRRVPIGVIGIIYEARPNVTIDCAALCLKSGNAAILRGGREIFQTNTALADLITLALADSDLPSDAVQLIPTTDRAALQTLLKLDQFIHCLIPRGGESLIRFVTQNSTIPVIKHYTGVCFVYLDRAADATVAQQVTVNAKTQRTGVCNAAEQLLVHRDIASALLPRVARALVAKGVELRCDATSAGILQPRSFPTDWRRKRTSWPNFWIWFSRSGWLTAWRTPSAPSTAMVPATAMRSSRRIPPPPPASRPPSTVRRSSGMRAPALMMASSSVLAPRSASAPTGCTRGVRWGCRSCAAISTW
jgi:glutamate-5-semialdehyde dehydrogenase